MKRWTPKRTHFRAYDVRGDLVLATWTSSAVTYTAERAVYQQRLDRGDFADVVIITPVPELKAEKMVPTRSSR